MFPLDVYYEVVRFIPIRELLTFRMVSQEFKQGSKSYDRNILVKSTRRRKSKRLSPVQCISQCFPNATVKYMSGGLIEEDTFNDFVRLKSANVGGTRGLTENALSKLPHLESLTCHLSAPSLRYSTHLCDLTIGYSTITDQELSHLPHLVNLTMTKCDNITTFQLLKSVKTMDLSNMKVTDEALRGMALTYLRVAICHNITSDGIQSLKELKNLQLINQVFIDDNAFNDMGIEELYICGTTSITDRGICALSQLQSLLVEPTTNPFVYLESPIHCKGVNQLRHLQRVWLRGSTITDCSDFEHLVELRLGQCTITDNRIHLWKKIKFVSLIETVCTPFDQPEIETLIIEDCPGMENYRRP
jgi:hypothetical protein